MIRLDATRISIVIVCSLCQWRSLELDRGRAWTAGADHTRTQHPAEAFALTAAMRSAGNNKGRP